MPQRSEDNGAPSSPKAAQEHPCGAPSEGLSWWDKFAPEVGKCLQDIAATIANLPLEEVHVVFLCERYNVLTAECFGQGSQMDVVLDIRSILRRAIVTDARKIILLHNHPVGGTELSKSDIVQTDRLANASRQVGIALVDHLIVSGEATTSLMQARYASTVPPRQLQASIADYARITVRIEHRKNFLEPEHRSALSGLGWTLAITLYFEERPTSITELARLAGTQPTVAIRWVMVLADLNLVTLTPSLGNSSMVFAELSTSGADVLDGLMSTVFWSGSDRVTLRSSRYALPT